MKIQIDCVDGRAIIKPAAYLGKRFYDYKAACDRGGASYDGARKVQVANLDSVPSVTANLLANGFQPVLTAAAETALRGRADTITDSVDAARERLAALKVKFAERGNKLMAFQEVGAEWLAIRHSGLLGDEQGLGKTIQVLAALEPDAAVVVSAPATAVRNWEKETAKWRPEFTTRVITRNGTFTWPVAGEMVIVTHDMLPVGIEQEREAMQRRTYRHDPSIGTPTAGTVVVIDEIQKGANPRTKRAKGFAALVEEAQAAGGRSWGLSGTPLRNHSGELWTVLSVLKVEREAFGSRKRFDELHDVSYGDYNSREIGKQIQTDAITEGLRRVMLRREKKDHLDLPPVLDSLVEVEIDAETMRLCDAVAEAVLAGARKNEEGIAAKTLERAIADAIESKMGAGFTELARARAALATAKIPAMLEFVEDFEEQGLPLIVFSHHRAPIDLLGARDGWAKITGDESPKRRQEIVEAFQQAKPGYEKGIALTIGAGAEAITITRASNMLFVDYAWTAASNNQARARFHRIGQMASMLNVYRLCANHEVDRHVDRILMAKIELTDATINAATVKDIDVKAAARNIETALATAHRVGDKHDDDQRAEAEFTKRQIGGARSAVNAEELDAESFLRDRYNSKPMPNDLSTYVGMLAARMRNKVYLTETQWAAAVRIANRYRIDD